MSKRRNNYRGGYAAKTNKSPSAVGIIAAIALLLAVAYVITSLSLGYAKLVGAPVWNPLNWNNPVSVQPNEGNGNGADDKENSTDNENFITAETDGGMIVDVSEGSALMGLRAVALSDEENYAISPQAEKSYSLTATVLPEDASNKVVDWSVTWKNSSSSFANGKVVTDYVTVIPTTDGALSATVSCLQAFGEQIVVTATVRGSSDLYATCTVDYVRKCLGSNFQFSTTLKEYPYSWNFTYNNLNPVVDFPTTVDLQLWGIGLSNTSLVSASTVSVTSDVYTKWIISMGSSFSFAYTEEYLSALRAAGLTPKVSAETYIKLSDRSFGNLFFLDCVGSTPVLPTTASTWSAFKTSLRNNADKAMIRVKCVEVISTEYVVETVYNVKFSTSSLASIATNITLGDTALEF